MGNMLSVLSCEKCQMACYSVLPLEEHALQQESVWMLPDSRVGDEECHRQQQNRCQPPFPWQRQSLLDFQAGTDRDEIVPYKKDHAGQGQYRCILAGHS